MWFHAIDRGLPILLKGLSVLINQIVGRHHGEAAIFLEDSGLRGFARAGRSDKYDQRTCSLSMGYQCQIENAGSDDAAAASHPLI
jgi:hypothetical protein